MMTRTSGAVFDAGGIGKIIRKAAREKGLRGFGPQAGVQALYHAVDDQRKAGGELGRVGNLLRR